MATDEQRETLRDWLAGLDDAVRETVVAWPPLTRVTSHEDSPLMAPAPGLVGVVTSYHDDGTVGVVAPVAETTTSPITGVTVRAGQKIRGMCDPERLVLLEYGDFTPDDVREALRDL